MKLSTLLLFLLLNNSYSADHCSNGNVEDAVTTSVGLMVDHVVAIYTPFPRKRVLFAEDVKEWDGILDKSMVVYEEVLLGFFEKKITYMNFKEKVDSIIEKNYGEQTGEEVQEIMRKTLARFSDLKRRRVENVGKTYDALVTTMDSVSDLEELRKGPALEIGDGATPMKPLEGKGPYAGKHKTFLQTPLRTLTLTEGIGIGLALNGLKGPNDPDQQKLTEIENLIKVNYL